MKLNLVKSKKVEGQIFFINENKFIRNSENNWFVIVNNQYFKLKNTQVDVLYFFDFFAKEKEHIKNVNFKKLLSIELLTIDFN